MGKFLVPVILIIIGFSLRIIGALFKIMHWPFGLEMIIISNAINIIAFIYLIFILIINYREKDKHAPNQ